jgi:CBS domain-containing protein
LKLATDATIPDIPVKELQLQQFTAIAPGTSIAEAVRTMISQKTRPLVFDRDDLLGIITASDIVKAYISSTENIGPILRDSNITRKPLVLEMKGTSLTQ